MKTILFIHGLGADTKDWWGSTESNIKHINICDTSISIDFWGYKTDKFSVKDKALNFVGRGNKLANLDGLGSQLVTHLETHYYDSEKIILFGHSMGGLVIASAINILRGNNSPVATKCTIAFCGSPLGGANLADRTKKYFNIFTSIHTKLLYRDGEIRKNAISELKNHVSVEGVGNGIPLYFFYIPEDEVVTNEEEIFGIFLNEVNANPQHINRTLTKGHSESVINLDIKDNNFKVIMHWLCTHSDIYNNRFFTQLSHQRKFDFLKNIVKDDDLLSVFSGNEDKDNRDKLLKDTEEKIKLLKNSYSQGEELSRIDELYMKKNHIVLEKHFTKTYLSGGFSITDINQKIEILKDDEDCIVMYYHGYDEKILKSLDYNLRDKLYDSLNKDNDRFKEVAFSAKMTKENNSKLKKITDMKFEEYNTDYSGGVLIILNLGKYSKGTVVEVLSSISMKTDVENTVRFINNAVKTFVTIQEEIYNSTIPKLDVRLERNGSSVSEELNLSTNIYYTKTSHSSNYSSINSEKYLINTENIEEN